MAPEARDGRKRAERRREPTHLEARDGRKRAERRREPTHLEARDRISALAASVLAGLGIVLLVAGVSARKLGDFDLPMHLTTGRALWQTGHLPRVDDFSYLHGTVRYVETVSVTLFYAAYRLGGPLGLQLVGGLAAGSVAVLLWARMRGLGAIALAATALAVAAMSTFLVVRSAELSFALLAATLWALDAHRRYPGTRRGRVALGAFVLLMLLWANVHGSVPLGLGIGAVYLGHRLASRFAPTRLRALLPERDGTDVGTTTGALALAAAVACINPGGPGVLLGPLRFGGGLGGLAAFTEWAPPTLAFFRDDEPVGAVVLVLGVLAGLFGRDARTGARMPALYDLLLVLVAYACARTAVRLLPHAVLLLAPWIAARFASRVGTGGLVRLACATGLVLAPLRILAVPWLPLGLGFDDSHLPEGAARWAQTHRPQGHLWNPSAFGGDLAFRLYPAVRILVDGRHPQQVAYATSDVLAVEQSEHDPVAFTALTQRLDLQWAVTRAFEGTSSGSPLAASEDWTMVFLDDVAAVYVRRGGADEALAAGGYRLLRHLTAPAEVLSLARRPDARAQDLAHDGALAEEQAPASPRATFLAACGALAVRDEAGFRAAIQRMSVETPRNATAVTVLEDAWGTATP